MYYGRQKLTDNERYLQDRVDQLEREATEEREAKQERWEQQERERKERWEQEYRTANSWPEALKKQAGLFQAEQDAFPDQPDDTFFGDGAAACRRGLEIWREVEAVENPKIAELRRQIEAIEEGIAAKVSELLEAEANGRSGWSSVAGAIVTEDPTNWLNW